MSEDKLAADPLFCAIFCDDIRDEVSGKTTIVGAFGADMIVNIFPVVIAKLGVYIKCLVPLAGNQSDLLLRIERNNEILIENNVTADVFAAPSRARVDGQDSATRKQIDIRFLLGPMQFQSACTLRAVVEYGGVTYVAGKLHVSLDEGGEAA